MGVPAAPEIIETARHPPVRAATLLPGPLSVAVIATAAITLDPAITITPFIGSGSRLYFAICTLIGLLLFAVLWLQRDIEENGITTIAAYSFLITGAPAFFLVDRIRAAWILVVLVLAIGISLLSSSSLRARYNVPVAALSAVGILHVWFLIAGITTFQLESKLGMPVAAAAALAGAVFLRSQSTSRELIGAALLGTVALMGAQMKLALNFVHIDPFLSATIWLFGIGLVFATVAIMQMRVT